MKILLNLTVHTCDDMGPNFRIWANKSLKHTAVNQLENLKLEIELENISATNTLMVEHYGKNPIGLTSDIAVELLEISFDGLILPRNLLYDQVFYPNWTWSDAPNFVLNNCYLGYNGVWHMAFPKDVRVWIMDYLEQEMFNRPTLSDKIAGKDNIDDFTSQFL